MDTTHQGDDEVRGRMVEAKVRIATSARVGFADGAEGELVQLGCSRRKIFEWERRRCVCLSQCRRYWVEKEAGIGLHRAGHNCAGVARQPGGVVIGVSKGAIWAVVGAGSEGSGLQRPFH